MYIPTNFLVQPSMVSAFALNQDRIVIDMLKLAESDAPAMSLDALVFEAIRASDYGRLAAFWVTYASLQVARGNATSMVITPAVIQSFLVRTEADRFQTYRDVLIHFMSNTSLNNVQTLSAYHEACSVNFGDQNFASMMHSNVLFPMSLLIVPQGAAIPRPNVPVTPKVSIGAITRFYKMNRVQ